MAEPPDHPAALPPDELYRQCRAERLRRGGPGGQHRNKVETAVRLVHLPTGVTAEASERRSQEVNRRKALNRLRVRLALEIRTPAETSRATSDLWLARLADGKIHVDPGHDDFPALLAEALDFLAARGHDVRLTAEILDCSTSQLVKFLKREPRAFEQVNQARADRGLDRLR